MGRAKPIELPSKRFAKRDDAIQFFRAMLHRYRDGEQVNDEDSLLLNELLQRLPDEKIGVGVQHFYRARNPEQPTSGFHVMRLDGKATDFSFMKCIDGKKSEPYDYYYRACRFAVSHYLTRTKNALFEAGPVPCSVSGELVTKETSEYRHTTPTFTELINRFAAERALEIDWSMFTPDRDMQYNVRFQDPAIEQAFVAFHMANSQMAIFRKKDA